MRISQEMFNSPSSSRRDGVLVTDRSVNKQKIHEQIEAIMNKEVENAKKKPKLVGGVDPEY